LHFLGKSAQKEGMSFVLCTLHFLGKSAQKEGMNVQKAEKSFVLFREKCAKRGESYKI
jgi:hypothetical protein